MNTDLIALAQRVLAHDKPEAIARDLLNLATRPTNQNDALQALLDEEAAMDAEYASEPWTNEQRRALFGMLSALGDNGTHGRDNLNVTRWDLVSMILGRTVQSFTDLTKHDASKLLDALNVIV